MDLSKRVQGPIGVDAENADGASVGLDGAKELAKGHQCK